MNENYNSKLKKAGGILLLVGLLDIIIMFYCIKNEINYRSSLNVFAVVAGLIIFFGYLKAVNFIAICSAIFLCMAVGSILLSPIYFTPGLLITYFKIKPIESLVLLFIILLDLIAFIYIYKHLTSNQITFELRRKGLRSDSFWKQPARGFLYGSAVTVIMLFFLIYMKNSDAANIAIEKARNELGVKYKYVVTALRSTSSASTWYAVTVTAYNPNEIKKLEYDWWEK